MENRSNVAAARIRPRMGARVGFTLVELLVVATVLVILVVLAAYAIVAVQEQARITQCASNLREVRLIISNYALTQNSWYPLWGYPGTGDQYALGSTGRWTGTDINGTPVNAGYNWNPPGPSPINGIGFGHSIGGVLAKDQGYYIRSWRVFYCPNLAPSSWFKGDVVNQWGNPSNWFNWPYAAPNIGYTYFNGNCPGWVNTTDNNWWQYVNPYYRGKKIYDRNNNTLFAPGSGTGNTSYAAGWMTDPSNWIIMADRARFSSSSPFAWNNSGADIFNTPNANHDAGMNTLYNDGSVSWAKYQTPVPVNPADLSQGYKNWYTINYNGVTAAGPK